LLPALINAGTTAAGIVPENYGLLFANLAGKRLYTPAVRANPNAG
jgi:hypothetical protein